VTRKTRRGGPPRRGQNPALLALQQRKRAQSHAQFESDVERFYRIKRLEASTNVMDWLIAFAAYEKLLERPELEPDLAVACLEGLSRARKTLQQIRPERERPPDAPNPLEIELDIAQRIVRLRGNHATSHYRLGHVLLDLARPDDALAAGKKAVALDPEHLPTWDLLAQCYRALGDRERGRQTYEHLLRLPVEPSTLHWRAVALLMTGNYLEGYPAYNTFVSPARNEPVLNWRGPYLSTLRAGQVPLWTGEVMPDGRLLLFFDGGASVTPSRWRAGSQPSGPASRRSAWR
jgi:tetratricopeptide (TPR) repeat protein